MKFLYRLLVLLLLIAILGLQLYFYKRLNEIDKATKGFFGDLQQYSNQVQKESGQFQKDSFETDFWKYSR